MTRATVRHRLARAAGPLAAALALLVALPGAVAAQDQDPTLALVAQTPTLDHGGAFIATLRAEGAEPGAQVRLTVHDRVRSRSELGRTFEGSGLRTALHRETLPVAALADGAGGLRVVLDLAEGTPAGQAVAEAGVYPVSVELLDADGARAAQVVTHLVLRPAASPAAPPLDVAVVLRVGAGPRPVEDGPLGERALTAAQSVVDAAGAVTGVPVTFAPTPDTLARLLAADGDEEAVLLDAMRALAASAPVLALPFVTTSPDALADAGLAGELEAQLDRGAATQRAVLGVTPTQATWLAGPDLGGEGVERLTGLGVRRTVVAADQVELVSEGVLTPAGPFEVVASAEREERGGRDDGDDPASLDALATDARLLDLLATEGIEPARLASRLLADLSMLWFERPGTARAVVLPVGADVDGEALRAVLEGLRAATLFRPVALDDAFRTAAPLTDRRGEVLRRTLLPDDPAVFGEDLAAEVGDLRRLQASVEGMAGPDAPVIDAIDAHALRATAAGLDERERQREVDAGRAAVDGLAAAVNTPEQASITLTAREGRVPLTIANDTGAPLDVRVHLTSPKLELPGGETIAMTLTEARSRLDIAVRTRASGSFPFQVEVTSPDGRVVLASTTYSVRSTAVSGVGVFLSAGAGLFLIVWWARHWREARRSGKLVAEPDA